MSMVAGLGLVPGQWTRPALILGGCQGCEITSKTGMWSGKRQGQVKSKVEGYLAFVKILFLPYTFHLLPCVLRGAI